MDIGKVQCTLNIEHIILGHVGGVELVHGVVLVAVLLLVLLRGGRDVLHALIYAKKLSVVFPNRVLFFFYFFARTLQYSV